MKSREVIERDLTDLINRSATGKLYCPSLQGVFFNRYHYYVNHAARQLGFTTFKSFIEASKRILWNDGPAGGGHEYLTIILTKEMIGDHIIRLIQRQNPKLMSCGPLAAELTSEHGYDLKQQYQALGFSKLKDFIESFDTIHWHENLHGGGHTYLTIPLTKERIEVDIIRLIQSQDSKQLPCGQLPTLLTSEHGYDLRQEYQALGFSKLKDFIESLSTIHWHENPHGGGHTYLTVATAMETIETELESSASHVTGSAFPLAAAVESKDSDSNTTVSASISDETTIRYVRTEADLLKSIRELASNTDSYFAMDCQGVPDDLFLIQLATSTAVYVFDCIDIDATVVAYALDTLLNDLRADVTIICHDLHNDCVALARVGLSSLNTLDTQLAMEALTKDMWMGFNEIVEYLKLPVQDAKRETKKQMDVGMIFKQRPLPQRVLEYAIDDIRLLLSAGVRVIEMLFESFLFDVVADASRCRIESAISSGGKRSICFDKMNNYRLASRELMEGKCESIMEHSALSVHDESGSLLELLRVDLREDLVGFESNVIEVTLDLGRPAHAWIMNGEGAACCKERRPLGQRPGDDEYLVPGRLVEATDIQNIIDAVGEFGSDNRAGVESQLHRISAMRNIDGDIFGLTLRVGRYVRGNADMVADLLFSDPSRSILFLGRPGSGKTTIVREVARWLSEENNVIIVDTSNEIAGDGNIPHPCVGLARRMMVPGGLDKQAGVMIECVQNHTPDVMVIDEIGRSSEVEAARTCKERGVRLIASAHGDLRQLIKNPKLRGLVGGLENVTYGDAEARAEQERRRKKGYAPMNGTMQKVFPQRSGAPVFDVVVVLNSESLHTWTIIDNVGHAVDRVLEGGTFRAQLRERDPRNGSVYLSLCDG